MYYVYILASGPNGALYTGHTDSLIVRIAQHRDELRPGFTAKYGVKRLVWYEEHFSRDDAKLREGRIKKWNRSWKIQLIRQMNPDWSDLYPGLF